MTVSSTNIVGINIGRLYVRGVVIKRHFCKTTSLSLRCAYFQERKSGPKRKLLGRTSHERPGGYPADVPARKLSPHRSERTEIKLFARTSLTRRRGRPWTEGVSEKLYAGKLWADVSFPIFHTHTHTHTHFEGKYYYKGGTPGAATTQTSSGGFSR